MKTIAQEEIPRRLRFELMGRGRLGDREVLSYRGFLSLGDVAESDGAPLEFLMNVFPETGEVQLLPEIVPGRYGARAQS